MLKREWSRRQKSGSMFQLRFCPPTPKWRNTTSLICQSEAGALRVFVAVDFQWVTMKTEEAEQIPTVSVDYGFFGQPGEPSTQHTSSARRARSQDQGHLESPSAGKGCDVPIPCEGCDDRFGCHGIQESHPQLRSGALHCCSL